MSFTPYTPPNAGDGPLTVDRDIAWRVGTNGKVDKRVIGAVAWAFLHFRISHADRQAILDGLGLEFAENPMGGNRLQPKAQYRK